MFIFCLGIFNRGKFLSAIMMAYFSKTLFGGRAHFLNVTIYELNILQWLSFSSCFNDGFDAIFSR